MIRNLKFLGLALVAALAMSSVIASMASADPLTSESGGLTTLTGKQGGTDVFKVHGGEVKCTSITYTGTFTNAAVSVTATPHYTGCTFAGLASTVETNGCSYLLTFDVTKNTEVAVDIVCPAGQEITVTAPTTGVNKKCIIHIPPQSDLTEITSTNIGTGTTREITLDINIKNVKYSQTAGTSETGNCATADSTTGGTYTGDATFTGSVGGPHVGIFLS